jgi:hypothetical protein
MSPDEVFVLLLSGITAFVGWAYWYLRLAGANRLGRSHSAVRPVLAWVPLLCLAGLYALLRTAASFDVRDAPIYLAFYVVFGAAWLIPGRGLFSLLGFSWQHDALDRRNPAAAAAVAGGLVGLTACYAGANIGDGPGWWCVAFAGGLATLGWFIAWAVVEAAGDVAEAITVERDVDAGVRLGAFLIAAGLLCGRGAAGDWTSATQTAIEFGDAWPLIPLTLGAAWVERRATAERAQPLRRSGSGTGVWLLGAVYIGFAILCLVVLPRPAENPKYGAPPATQEAP